MVRILCVGNRWVAQDSLGPLVHDLLQPRSRPKSIEVVDGGLQGLNLLSLVERSERVVFVDALEGFGAPREVVEVGGVAALEGASSGFGHSSGLGYLLRAIGPGCEGPVPSWVVVGAQGIPDDALVGAVAERAMALARAPAQQGER